MCFGPVASFTASGFLAAIGAAVIKNIRSKKEILFAAFPVLFSLQQFIEGCLWVSLKDGKSQTLVHGLAFAFLIFAYSLWPVLCPLSVYAIEYHPQRRQHLRILIILGLATSFYLLLSILTHPFDAVILNCSIRYETYVAGARMFTGVYFAVTILPYFFSSHRDILIFGIPNLIFCTVAYALYQRAFISTWCFFAAVLSMTLYFFLRKLHHQPLLPLPKH